MAKGTPNEGISGTLANGLIAHYSFNDESLNDSSGNGRNLTKVGTVNDVAYKDGQAKDLSGLNNSLETFFNSSPLNPVISAVYKSLEILE